MRKDLNFVGPSIAVATGVLYLIASHDRRALTLEGFVFLTVAGSCREREFQRLKAPWHRWH